VNSLFSESINPTDGVFHECFEHEKIGGEEKESVQIFFFRTKYSAIIINRGRDIARSILAVPIGFFTMPSSLSALLFMIAFPSPFQFLRVSCNPSSDSSPVYSLTAKHEYAGVFALK